MKGLTATQLITALAVGLLIIGILAFLIITWTSRGSGEISEQACRARAVSLCSAWSLCDFGTDCAPDLTAVSGSGTFNDPEGCGKFFTLSDTYCKSISLV